MAIVMGVCGGFYGAPWEIWKDVWRLHLCAPPPRPPDPRHPPVDDVVGWVAGWQRMAKGGAAHRVPAILLVERERPALDVSELVLLDELLNVLECAVLRELLAPS